jgi:thiamine-monophosphate kinase
VRRVRDLGEFGLVGRIERIARPGARGPVALGIGDDAAVLRLPPGRDLVLTTDALVEDVHFRWRSETPGRLGARLLAVNLSDLAAMGARPAACLLSAQLPPDLPAARLLGVVRGLAAAGARSGCPLVGGNLARARETSLALLVLGAVERGRALRRGAARAGDRIFVTGSLGGAALALARLERGGRSPRPVPIPRLRAGQALARLPGAGACIDVSDGLLADLGHLLRASGVGAEIDLGRVPRPRGFEAACRRLGLDPGRLLLAGGEDYELLFTVRPGAPGAALLRRRLGVAVSEIGVVTRRGLRVRGGPRPIRPGTPGGWRHF